MHTSASHLPSWLACCVSSRLRCKLQAGCRRKATELRAWGRNAQAGAAVRRPDGDVQWPVRRPDGDVELRDAGYGFFVPPCGKCGGPLKPDVVFFGDGVPAWRAQRWVAHACNHYMHGRLYGLHVDHTDGITVLCRTVVEHCRTTHGYTS